MKNKAYFIFNLISVVAFAVLLCLFGVFGAASSTIVYAAENDEVLQDLQRDKTFNKDEYPHKPEANDLQVITVAEGEGEQLFVYVYNPSMNALYNATYIRMSYTIGNSYSPSDYALELVSSSGVFQKYYVKDFSVKRDRVRYYDITCIFRKFIDGVDEDCETETKNHVRQIPFEVAKCYTACTLNGEVTYECEEVQTVTITSKYGFTGEYDNGFSFKFFTYTTNFTHSHVIAFSTDWDIDKLLSARIKYSTQSYRVRDKGVGYLRDEAEYGEPVMADPVTIYADDVGTNNPTHFWLEKFSWKRIQSSADYLKEVEQNGVILIDSDKDLIAKEQWVLAFTETEFTEESGWILVLDQLETWTERKGTIIDNVSLLSLGFVTDGKTYNLGVVDNYQSINNEPIFSVEQDDFALFWEYFVKIITTILFVILVVLLLNFVTPVANILKFILKAIIFVVTIPFRLLKKIFKKDG